MLPIANRKRPILLPRKRRGVSLLEVLISIFVLMVGLLGVAALIPAARFHMAESIKADRAAACGRTVLQEVKIRGWLNPRMWRCPDGTATGAAVVVNGNLLPARVYAIDPLFIAYNNGSAITAAFPYLSAPAEGNRLYGGWEMMRVTFSMPTTNTIMPLPVAERLCRWHDDLLFVSSSDPDDRPRQMEAVDLFPGVANDDLVRIPWPIRGTDGVTLDADDPPQPLFAESQGDYSWLLTVTPIGDVLMLDPDGDGTNMPYIDITRPISYSVSVVIFHRRELRCPTSRSDAGGTPAERMITQVSFPGGGLSGGDAILRDDEDSSGVHHPVGYLDVKEKDWLMVPYLAHTDPTSDQRPSPFEWYRVVLTSGEAFDAGSKRWHRYVTLEGRDWPFDYNNAALFSNIISVFTATYSPESNN